MKKIGIAAAALLLAAMITACGAGDVGGPAPGTTSSSPSSSSSAASSALSQDSLDDNLKGLQTYLESNASFSGTAEKMRADMVGAENGVRYQFGYNGKNNVTVELYEYNIDSLDDQSKTVLDEVKSNGSFTILNEKVGAVLSDSGKYLMVFKDTATDDQNKAYAEKVKTLFTEFKK